MKYPQRIGAFVALAAAMAVPGALLRAQTAPAAAEPTRSDAASPETGDLDLVILSPFEVTATKGGSYVAATSLAGNRLNTELRDVGSAISVVTEQFMKDIGATNNETLLQYTTNTEVGNIYGNFTNAGSGTQLNEMDKFLTPNSNTRVRGLASADNTRDFFVSDIPWDGYNVDRVDMQRGPNAILFGLGSPAGIINNSTRTARLSRTSGSLEYRFGSFGSQRTAIDYNQVLVEDQLAVRLDALWNNEKYKQDPAFQKDKRIYGALRYEPGFLNKGSAHTIFKASFEHGDVDSNRPRTMPPGDNITPWFQTGTTAGYTVNGIVSTPITYANMDRAGYDVRSVNDKNVVIAGSTAPAGALVSSSSTYQPWLGNSLGTYYGGPVAIFDSGDSSAARYYVMTPRTVRGLNSAGGIDGNIGGIPNAAPTGVTNYRTYSKILNLPGAKFGLTRNLVITDASIFDFYNNLIDGPNKKEWADFEAYNLNLSQTFLDGSLGFEAVYDHQEYSNGQLSFMGQDKTQTIYIDTNKVLVDGTTNPNFGRPQVSDNSAGGNNSRITERDSFRVTAFAQHDFAKNRHNVLWAKLLGRHVLTGLYSDDSTASDSRSWQRYGTDLAFKDMMSKNSSTVVKTNDNLRLVYPLVYLGGSLAGNATASGAHIPRITAPAVAKTGSVLVYDSTWVATGVNPADAWTNTLYPVGNSSRTSTQSENPANYKGWVNMPLNVLDSEEGNRDALTTSASLGKYKVKSKAGVYQGYFWDGAIVGMFGYRKDEVRTAAFTAYTDALGISRLDQSVYKLPNYTVMKDDSRSWSVVTHLTKLFAKNLPFDVSLSYNQSENFQPGAGRIDAYGSALANPTGDTKDIGMVIATKDGRYSLKVNKYVSKVFGASASGLNVWYLGGAVANGSKFTNVYEYNLGNGGWTMDYANQGNQDQYNYTPNTVTPTLEEATALEAKAIAGWRALEHAIPQAFYDAWRIENGQVKNLSSTTPAGLAATEDDTSRGYEFELYAEPIKNLRLTLNASQSKATRKNIGGEAFNEIVGLINTALNNTNAGDIRLWWGNSTTTILSDWNASFYANWKAVKVQEGSAVPELRQWRANLIANYDFTTGFMKGVSIGAGYRWQDKVVLGYKPIYLNPRANWDGNPATATDVTFDLDSPFYGPSETNIDLWVGYQHKLTAKIDWRIQLNVRNVGKGNDLIPITVQPDGTPAAYRIAPCQVWTLSNTFSF